MANKLVYEDYAVGASEHAQIISSETDNLILNEDNSTNDYYDPSRIFENTSVTEYSTFESKGFQATKSARFYTATPSAGTFGYISSVQSNSNGVFDTPPKLTIGFDNQDYYSGNGISLYFNGSYCTSVKAAYYSGNTLLYEFQYNVDSMSAFLPAVVDNYNKIVITFLQTQDSYQFAKVGRIQFGRTVTFEDFNYLHSHQKLYPLGDDIAIGTLEGEIVSFNGIELEMRKNQKIKLYHAKGGNVEITDNNLYGTYWISEASKVSNKIYSFVAEDVIGKLDNAAYEGYLHNGSGFFDVLVPVMNTINCHSSWGGTSDYSYLFYAPSSWRTTSGSINIYGLLPHDTLRKCIAMLNFVRAGVLYPTKDGNFEFKDAPSLSSAFTAIPASRILGQAIYTKNDIVKNVTHETYTYNLNNEYTKITQLSVSQLPYEIYFQNPVSAVGYSTPGSDNVFPLGSNKNTGTHLTVTTLGSYSTLDVKASYSNVVTEDHTISQPVSSSVTSTEKRFSNYTVRTYNGYRDWLEALASKIFANKGYVSAEIVLNGEKLGDYVSMPTKYSGVKNGIITDMETDIGYNELVSKVVVQEWQTI